MMQVAEVRFLGPSAKARLQGMKLLQLVDQNQMLVIEAAAALVLDCESEQ
jgi:hypothetical protein